MDVNVHQVSDFMEYIDSIFVILNCKYSMSYALRQGLEVNLDVLDTAKFWE